MCYLRLVAGKTLLYRQERITTQMYRIPDEATVLFAQVTEAWLAEP